MPTYDFQIRDGDKVLQVVALTLPIGKRDAITIERVKIPQRIRVMGSATDNPNDDHRIDMKNLRASEDRLGSNFDRFHGRSKEEMRKIWKKEPQAA